MRERELVFFFSNTQESSNSDPEKCSHTTPVKPQGHQHNCLFFFIFFIQVSPCIKKIELYFVFFFGTSRFLFLWEEAFILPFVFFSLSLFLLFIFLSLHLSLPFFAFFPLFLSFFLLFIFLSPHLSLPFFGFLFSVLSLPFS